ncbi:hypothetical protein M0R72_08040 [Candidatus Pacearchaeota archaeon]|jgi:hypothetical protein|nr:hypothetical protein [Candidatus Pacearchaeota archaeon]
MKALAWIGGIAIGVIVLALILMSFGIGIGNRVAGTTDAMLIRYEEFQDIYNTCVKLNTDLCNMKAVPETDKMFEQFSKEQRLLALRTNLNKWVEDYNAKSKMWNRALWKSKSLPYQLTTQKFNCY